MNWANRLTLGRLALTVLFVLSLSSSWTYGRTIALVLFVLAGISDYFDGEIARRYGIVTKFGKLMDPLVDKVMMAAAFICLVPLGAVPAWVATIVVARDFLITGLRLLASSEGVILPAEKLGKHKTSWQIATVLFFLLLLSTHELGLAATGRRLVGKCVALRRQHAPLGHDRPHHLLWPRLSLAPSWAAPADRSPCLTTARRIGRRRIASRKSSAALRSCRRVATSDPTAAHKPPVARNALTLG